MRAAVTAGVTATAAAATTATTNPTAAAATAATAATTPPTAASSSSAATAALALSIFGEDMVARLEANSLRWLSVGAAHIFVPMPAVGTLPAPRCRRGYWGTLPVVSSLPAPRRRRS